ncbi:MAG: 3-isopropylmalate dehydratase small subunit [Bacteroidales bacterium]|jgi:3-isopropylmalate/(R)-2-methylmalate dehydratase small subunit|nr:3-isopropylmalate dehydratase small subunit [Bacteroidales bacterium]
MAKEKLNLLESTCVPLPVENVDTDQIIPARFLSSTSREGFGDNLFRDWRFDHEGRPLEGFILNNKKYSGKILVAGKNFGCGSSREHAVWAVYDYGFRVVISSFFADIFRNNALNNGLLPLILPEHEVQNLMTLVTAAPETTVKINVMERKIEIPSSGKSFTFEINPYKQECLIYGLDDIDYLINMRGRISDFEKKRGGLR